MSLYYDETIFTDARTLLKYNNTEVNAFNRADIYLLERANISIGSKCDGRNTESSEDDQSNATVVNLNPRRPCRGINIYTLSIVNKKISQVEPFNQITVFQGESNTPLSLNEYIPNTIYTVGNLTSFESAILIKYYAINNKNVTITRDLYTFIRKHFQDQRSWFNYNDVGIIQNENKELIQNMDIVYIPINTISGPEMLLQ